MSLLPRGCFATDSLLQMFCVSCNVDSVKLCVASSSFTWSTVIIRNSYWLLSHPCSTDTTFLYFTACLGLPVQCCMIEVPQCRGQLNIEPAELYTAFSFAVQSAGVRVNLFQHTLSHGTPDAVFPNNWFSTHPASEAGGQSAMVLYPMKTKNR